MPLQIVRQDITKIKCDAIVNPTNVAMFAGGGVDKAIHRVAGKELDDECDAIGGCAVGDAKITKGYGLPCKYVIHTVGPHYRGGLYGEEILLRSCYEKSLALAKANHCETLAFPLIASGTYGYPKEEALKIANESISKFLLENEMLVFLVVFDEDSFKISEKMYGEVKEYIDCKFILDVTPRSCNHHKPIRNDATRFNKNADAPKILPCYNIFLEEKETLEEMLKKKNDSFSLTLLKLIDKKGMTEVECYKKANVSKQTWYKIMNDGKYRPSKNTAIAFAIALRLDLEETKDLLETVGFSLSHSCRGDIIIEYFIKNSIYDIFTINETLFDFGEDCLGV